MTVLITGAGLVGAQIARLEQEAGRTPVLFDIAPRTDALAEVIDLERCNIVRGDLLNAFDIVKAIKAHGVRRIIHTAAFPGLTPGGQAAPLAAIQVNVLGTAHVLEAARLMEVERVVVCSSSALTGSLEGGEDNGAAGFENAYPRTSSVYATSKQAAENLATNYANTLGLDTVAIRLAGVFGPWAAGGGGPATAAMEGWLRAALRGGPVEVLTGQFEWVYSKDAARGAVLACWADGLKDRVFNIGTGLTYDSESIVEALRSVCPEAHIYVPNSQTGNALTQFKAAPMSTERSRTQLNYQPEYSLAQALADYREWLTGR